MPKINANDNATYFGHAGVVENAHGEKFELDPSTNLDGSRVDGYESDEDTVPVAVDGTEGVPSTGTDAREEFDSELAERESEKESPTEEKPAPAKRTAAKK